VRMLPAVLVLLLLPAPALPQGMPPAGVRTGVVREESVRDVVTGVATVEPWLRTVLSVEIAGLVEEYPLREGDRVEAGETLVCELKATDLVIDLAEAEALLARAEAEAETAVKTARATMEEKRAFRDRAERDWVRAQDLFAKQVITKSEHDRAEADAIAAKYQFERAQKDHELAEAGQDSESKAREAEVRRAKARLDRVKDRIDKTRLVSPVDGVVVRRMTEVGAWVNPGVPVIEILTLDPVLVRFAVSERDIAKVEVGDPAVVRVDAHPGRDFAGKVRFIVPEAARKSRSFPVLIEVPNPAADLKSGMFARVELGVGKAVRALTVPKDAIVRGPQGTVVFTFEKVEGQDLPVAKLIPVTTGIAVGGRVVVTGPGLASGMPVVTTGNEKLFPGQPVIPSGGGGPPGGGHGGPPGGKPGGGGEKAPAEDGR